MFLSNKAIATIIAASAIAGGAIEAYVSSYKKTEQRIVEVDKQANNITTTIKESTNKDGSSQKETIIVDKSKTQQKRDESLLITERTSAPSLMISLSTDTKGLYGVDAKKRVLGNIFVGGYVDTKSQFGVSIGLLF